MVGSTFAFFTATVNRTQETEQPITASTAKVTATFSDGSLVSLDGEDNTTIAPGWTGNKTITIQNSGDAAIDYSIAFIGEKDEDAQNKYTNGFTNLQYKLEKSGEGNANGQTWANIVGLTTSEDENYQTLGKKALKDEDDNVLVTGHLEPNEKHEFTLTFRLKNLETPQEEQGASFKGKLIASGKAVPSKNTGA